MHKPSAVNALAALVALTFAVQATAQPVLIGCTANFFPATPPSFLVDIDPTTGAASNPRDTGIFLIGGIATHPSTNELYGLTTFASTPASTLVRLNVATGAATVVGYTGLPNIVEGDLAFNPVNGMLYGIQDFGATFNQRNLFRIDPNNGAATVIGSLGTDGDFSALAFNAGGVLYAIDDLPVTGFTSVLHTLDPSTGVITSSISLNATLGGAIGLTFDPATGIAYVADGGQSGTGLFYSLDVTSGILTAIGPTGIQAGLGGLAFVGISEPSSPILMVVVLIAGYRHVVQVLGAGRQRLLAFVRR